MLTMDEARTRVARGAAHLDQVRPGWHTRIDTGTLTLHDPCGCIVGQLTGNRYFRCLDLAVLSPRTYGMDLSYGEIDDYDERAGSYQPLQDAWIEAIAARLHPVSQESVTDASSADAVREDVTEPIMSIRA